MAPYGYPQEDEWIDLPRLVGKEKGKDIWEDSAGESFYREPGQGPGTPWVSLPYDTKLNDLRSLTIWGKPGTSVGDAWEPSLIATAKQIVGNSPDVTPEHIKQFEAYLKKSKRMPYMAEHPGREAFAPENQDEWVDVAPKKNAENIIHPAIKEEIELRKKYYNANISPSVVMETYPYDPGLRDIYGQAGVTAERFKALRRGEKPARGLPMNAPRLT